jgi:Putative Ig domain
MNSRVSDLDHLADDDIAGVKFLYEPRITSALTSSSVQVGSQFNYQITANNNPTSFGAFGLPDGLNVNTVSGQISGSANSTGNYRVLIIAYSSFGNALATIAIQVASGYVTSPSYSPEATVGSHFSPYQITATNQPTSFSATGLPSGLTIDSATGIISGNPDRLLNANK